MKMDERPFEISDANMDVHFFTGQLFEGAASNELFRLRGCVICCYLS